jgi:hypothetical protein
VASEEQEAFRAQEAVATGILEVMVPSVCTAFKVAAVVVEEPPAPREVWAVLVEQAEA